MLYLLHYSVLCFTVQSYLFVLGWRALSNTWRDRSEHLDGVKQLFIEHDYELRDMAHSEMDWWIEKGLKDGQLVKSKRSILRL